jgi:hypothetical protein
MALRSKTGNLFGDNFKYKYIGVEDLDTHEAAQKLMDAGLYARALGDGKKILGGTHKKYYSDIGVIYGHFSLEIKENCVMITISKDSIEEAVQFITDNINPGVSDEIPKKNYGTGPMDY